MKPKLLKLLAETTRHMTTYIRSHYRNDKKVLREKQMNVFKAVHSFFKKKLLSGYIKLPTGTGKTVLFGQIIRTVANSKSRALIVVPRIQLVQQTYESLKQFAPELGVGRIDMHHKEYGHKVAVLTYTSWQIQLRLKRISIDEFDYIILDEGHRALAPKIEKLVRKAKKESIVLGFSATPGFSGDKHLNELLEHEIYTMELHEAICLGLLSGARIMLVELDIDLSKTASARGDYDTKDLEKLINTKKVNDTALKVYKKYFNGECAIIYANSIQHVHDVVETFLKKGINAQAIHGSMPKKQREKILHDYQIGTFNVLVNCDLLNEGFDEPRVSVCLNLRPTQSAVLAEQRGGRVLRLDSNNPNKIAHVVDFIYKESSRRKKSILFSQITGGAHVLPDLFHTSKNPEQGGIRELRELIEIEGLKIIYDVYTIDEITKYRSEHNNKIKESYYRTWQEAAQAAINLGIYDSRSYLVLHKKDPRLNSAPSRFYEDFPGWFVFLKGVVPASKYKTWQEASRVVQKAKIGSVKEYKEFCKKDPKLYNAPNQAYSNFPGWYTFLGKKKQVLYRKWKQAHKIVKTLGLVHKKNYLKIYKNYSGLPGDPGRFYRDFPGWDIFLGKK